jgi:hypothetical protein
MTKKINQHEGIITTNVNSIASLQRYQNIFIPFLILIFIQLLILEIMYFAPRYPLNLFFGPLIKKIWGDAYMHYPWNLALLPKLFQNIQIPLFIFISSFMVAAGIGILNDINDGRKGEVATGFRKALKSYLHIVLAAGLTFVFVWALYKLFNLVYGRALIIGSTKGIKYFIKVFIVYGAPYFTLMLGALATAFTGYLLPAIIIDRKSVFTAVVSNFKTVFRNFFFTLGLVIVPYLFFAPALLLRQLISIKVLSPDLTLWVMALSVILTVVIDAVVYTSLATAYIINKERK